MKSLVWTRPASDWVSDEILLKSMAAKARIERLPCVKILPVAAKKITGSYDTFVFTSSKAADLALADAKMVERAKGAANIFTHGPSTAKTLAKHGLKAEVIDVRTGQELATALKTRLAPGARVLWPRVEDPAHDIETDLKNAGFDADSFVCYRTETRVYGLDGKPLAKGRLEELKDNLTGVVCFASPSAVEGFLKDLPGKSLIAVALGPTTTAACEGRFKRLYMASENGIEALVKRAVTALTE